MEMANQHHDVVRKKLFNLQRRVTDSTRREPLSKQIIVEAAQAWQ